MDDQYDILKQVQIESYESIENQRVQEFIGLFGSQYPITPFEPTYYEDRKDDIPAFF